MKAASFALKGIAMEIDESIKTIAELSKSQRLTLMIGSGLSANFPCWSLLIGRMAELVEKYSAAYAAAMLDDLRHGALIAAADFFGRENRVPRAARAEFFRSVFSKSMRSVPDEYELACKLPAHIFLTTNFDTNLSDAADFERVDADLQDNDEASLRSFIDNVPKKRQIVHLHGRAHKFDTLVYDTETYKAIGGREVYKEVLREAFTRTCVIAVGYSMSDPDILWISKYVAEELGGAGRSQHFIVLDREPANADVLRRANWTVVRYPEGEHGNVKRFLRGLVGETKKTLPASLALTYVNRVASRGLRTLAVTYASVTGSSENAYESAGRAVVIRILRDAVTGYTVEQIVAEAAAILSIPREDARRIAGAGIRALEEKRELDGDESGLLCLKASVPAGNSLPDNGMIEDAVITRARTYDSRVPDSNDLHVGIKRVVSEVMFAEGLTIARSFFDRDSPEGYDLERLTQEAVAAELAIEARYREPISRALVEVFSSPTKEQSQVLQRLANAAYVIERIMLHPRETDLGGALGWRMYFDSNVLLRYLAPGDSAGRVFSRLIERFKQLGIPLFVLWPFVEEIYKHVEMVERTVASAARVEHLAKLVESQTDRERSPILLWFYEDVVKRRVQRDFKAFRRAHNLTSADAIARLLKERGFVIDGRDAVKLMDTSRRETLWDHLRKASTRDADSRAGRTLRRNEATQIEWIRLLREKNQVRAWFLSNDSQLRRSLRQTKREYREEYSDYVVTPVAWAMRLNEMHWAEVGAGGFVELMWSLPERGMLERLTDITLAKMIDRLVNGAQQIEPEQIRDSVESAIRTRLSQGALEAVEGADDPDAELEQIADDVIVPSVSERLDEMIRMRSKAKRAWPR